MGKSMKFFSSYVQGLARRVTFVISLSPSNKPLKVRLQLFQVRVKRSQGLTNSPVWCVSEVGFGPELAFMVNHYHFAWASQQSVCHVPYCEKVPKSTNLPLCLLTLSLGEEIGKYMWMKEEYKGFELFILWGCFLYLLYCPPPPFQPPIILPKAIYIGQDIKNEQNGIFSSYSLSKWDIDSWR